MACRAGALSGAQIQGTKDRAGQAHQVISVRPPQPPLVTLLQGGFPLVLKSSWVREGIWGQRLGAAFPLPGNLGDGAFHGISPFVPLLQLFLHRNRCTDTHENPHSSFHFDETCQRLNAETFKNKAPLFWFGF